MKKDTREDGQFQIPVETSSPLFRFVCSLPSLMMFTSVENVCLYNIGAFLLNLSSSNVAISSHRLQFISLACILPATLTSNSLQLYTISLYDPFSEA